MDRSGTGSRQRRASSVSHKLRHTDNNVGVLDSVSNASLMEVFLLDFGKDAIAFFLTISYIVFKYRIQGRRETILFYFEYFYECLCILIFLARRHFRVC